MPGSFKTRRRPAQHPLRRGGSHPPPLLARAGAGQRDREGRAAAEAPASAAGWSRSSGSTSSSTRGAATCCTVTGVATVDGYPRAALRRAGARSPAPAPATRCCACSTRPSPTRPPTTCSAATWRCSTTPRGRAPRGTGRRAATALAFRLKLALAAGFAPELASCARCGEAEQLVGFSGAAGGVVCGSLRGGLLRALRGGPPVHGRGAGKPLAEAPEARSAALRQVERAVGETLEHHAHVQLRAAA